MREATLKDLPQFARAAQEFTPNTPYSLDIESFLENVIEILQQPNVKGYINGEGHCVVMLVPSLYDRNQVIARVITTWGKGALRCFKACEQWAKDEGAALLFADSYFKGSKIETFYERLGMVEADHLFYKVL